MSVYCLFVYSFIYLNNLLSPFLQVILQTHNLDKTVKDIQIKTDSRNDSVVKCVGTFYLYLNGSNLKLTCTVRAGNQNFTNMFFGGKMI